MEEVRKIVSLGLEARAKAGIKVRQPLKKFRIKNLKLKNNEDLIKLIKDELNVKEVVFDDKILLGEVDLDTKITPELKEEGGVKRFDSRASRFEKKIGLESRAENNFARPSGRASQRIYGKIRRRNQKISRHRKT